MSRSDAANRLERLLRRDLGEAAREAGPPSADEIDAYVAGRASTAEREVIESWLADDPALREEVDALMAMRQAIGSEAIPEAAAEAAAVAAPIPREEFAPDHKPKSKSKPNPAAQPKPAPQPKPARASARKLLSPKPQTRPATPGSLQATAREMRARPMRTAALLAIAASLAFFILWIATPSRPPVEPKLASGGAAPSSPASAPSATLTLRDAGGEVSLLANGELRGLDGLDVSHRSAVVFALTKGRLEIPGQVDALAASAGTLRAPGDAAAPPALRVVKPLATNVRTQQPTFEWTAVPGASSYRVRIADAALNPVVESPMLTTTSWTPQAPLPSGRVLMWQVEAQTPRGAIIAPAPPAPEARILVLRSVDAEALSRELIAAKGSDLAAAVALARFGILDEADTALARLAAANRNADVIARLRQQLSDRRFPR